MSIYNEIKELIENIGGELDKGITPIFVTRLVQRSGYALPYICSLLAGELHDSTLSEIEQCLATHPSLLSDIYKLKGKFNNLIARSIDKDTLSGGVVQKITFSIGDDGSQVKTIVTKKLPPKIVEKFLSADPVDRQESFVSHEDIATIARTKGLRIISDIIPEQEINKAVESMMPYQFNLYKELENDIFQTEKFNVHHVYKGGFQSGKTTAVTIIVGKLLNMINKTKQLGHVSVTFMGANLNSIHTNIIQRLCSTFPSLKGKEPSHNSTIWNIGNDFKIRLVSTSNKHYDTLKGSTITFCYIDELDAITEEMLTLLISRLSEGIRVEDNNGRVHVKNIMIATMNPRDPGHHVSQYIHNEDTGLTLHEISTACNTCINADYHKALIASNGGEGTAMYKRYYEGKTVSLASHYSVFALRDEMFTNVLGNEEERLRSNYRVKDIHIGVDYGTASQTCFVAVAKILRQKDNKEIVGVFKELVFGDRDLKSWGEIHELQRLRIVREFFREIERLCIKAYIYIPHDAAEMVEFCQKIINDKEFMMFNIRPTVKEELDGMKPFAYGIFRMKAMFTQELVAIDISCKNLQRQLYGYTYNPKFMETETCDEREKILRRDDHSIDAFRYGVLPIIDDIIRVKHADWR